MPIFIVFGLTRLGIEPESTASVADALSTRPLISFYEQCALHIKIFERSTSSQVRMDREQSSKNCQLIATKYRQFIQIDFGHKFGNF